MSERYKLIMRFHLETFAPSSIMSTSPRSHDINVYITASFKTSKELS